MKLNFVQKSRSYYKNNFCQLLPSTPYQTFLSLPKCFTTEQSTVEASFLLYDKESNNFPYLDADKRYFRRKFTSSVEEPTYSYRRTSTSADWPEKYFSGQSARRSNRVTLSPSYTKRFSSSNRRTTGKFSWRVSEEKMKRKMNLLLYTT